MQMSTFDLKRKSYFSWRSNPETMKIAIYAKIQSSSSIFVKLHFGPPTHVKLRSGPQYFQNLFSVPKTWKIYFSLQTFQNFKINPLSNLNLINTPNFPKIKSKSQFPQNYHFATVQNFKSVPKCQISHSILQIFTIMQNFSFDPCDTKLR